MPPKDVFNDALLFGIFRTLRRLCEVLESLQESMAAEAHNRTLTSQIKWLRSLLIQHEISQR